MNFSGIDVSTVVVKRAVQHEQGQRLTDDHDVGGWRDVQSSREDAQALVQTNTVASGCRFDVSRLRVRTNGRVWVQACRINLPCR